VNAPASLSQDGGRRNPLDRKLKGYRRWREALSKPAIWFPDAEAL
jgi:hypothetical protein